MDQFATEPRPSLPKRALVTWASVTLVVAVVLGLVALLPRIFAELQYPLDYEQLIVAEAVAHDLDPFLVAAVVYAESRYKPSATSPVGARGLMQLMPRTAQGIARKLGETGFTTDDLNDPATNLRFGTFHLQGLMGRYDSDVEAALVGYNGGGGAGDRYQAGERNSVPRESLRYVRKVLEARGKYEELYPTRLASSVATGTSFEEPADTALVDRLLQAVQSAISARLQ